MTDAVFGLAGRTALVTGARRGIGRAIAVALADAGADLVLLARDADLTETEELVRAAGVDCAVVTADLSDPESGRAAVTELLRDRPIDILVNNAGIILRADAVDVEYHDWQAVLEVNLNAVWLLCQTVGAHMVARGSGKIVNVASVLSFQGGIRVPAYAAAKHAVAGLTKALANEWAAHGVQVNAIAPGYIATDNTAALRQDEGRSAEILARIPAGRWGRPEDVGAGAVFLASSAADYVTGQILAVDGGWMAR